MPNIVFSLLGAGDPIADNDLNAREAYYSFLRKNHFVNMQIIRLLFSAYSAGNMQLDLRIATEKRVCYRKHWGIYNKNILSCWKKVVLLQIETNIEDRLCKQQ